MSQERANETWLSLGDAAAYLNVHPATLRRWSDAGEIPHMLTPGGHRRYALADLQRFAESHRVARRAVSLAEAWADRAMTRARQALPERSVAGWLATLDEPMRERHRALGRRLMGLTLQYVSADDGAHLLDEARALGKDYGELSKTAGASLKDALQAALFFRDKLLEATLELSETAPVRPGDSSKLVKRINALLNVVQLAIAEVYESDAPGETRQRRKHRA
ncbi:MAG: helix-turn-helix domain-containing protein [Anaerolineae bacterium]|nr:helix-turn-helix domain-containing protein [Candidatus Roseilinea sp.]MDW8448661.1 helix-turn-helix domain-containing protein [Anaerolineae bacterium]